MKSNYQKMYWILYGIIIIYAFIKIFLKIDHAQRTPLAEVYTYTSYIVAFIVELGALEILLRFFKLSPDKIGERILRKYPSIDLSQTIYDPSSSFEKRYKKFFSGVNIAFIILLAAFLWFRFSHHIKLEILQGTILNLFLCLLAPILFVENFKNQNRFYQKMDDLMEEQEFLDTFPDLYR